jgi:hypothetical protein
MRKLGTQEIEIFIGEQGKSATLVVTHEQMQEIREKMNAGTPFLNITDAAGCSHIFNMGAILAITTPGCHDLCDTDSLQQMALQLHDKEIIDDDELCEILGIKGNKRKNKRKMGLQSK